MATKKIINVEPEAPSAEQALYDVAFEEVGADGVTCVTHRTMTEQEIATEVAAEVSTETALEAQEAVVEPPQESVADSVQEVVPPAEEAPVAANIVPVVTENTVEAITVAQPLTTEQEGYAMYFLGGDLGQNPYMDITEEYFAWNAGWAKGFDEANKVKE